MRPSSFALAAVLSGLVTFGLCASVGCDDSSHAVKETVPDAATPIGGDGGGADGGADGAPSDCFTNPQTHYEIINACTNAVKIDKSPTLPLLYADGGLPPVP
jgi:hypothetical protein